MSPAELVPRALATQGSQEPPDDGIQQTIAFFLLLGAAKSVDSWIPRVTAEGTSGM